MPIFFLEPANCVFIHIPKTGGGSIRRGLFQGAVEGPEFGEMPAAWRGKFAFCFVRNPFDRLISAWKMFTQGMQDSVWAYPADGDPTLSLAAFLDIVEDERVGDGIARQTFAQKVRQHTLPQTHPLNSLSDADFVGRFERYQADLAHVLARIGRPGVAAAHMNRTVRGDYRDYFDTDTRARAEAFYAEDLSRLGYRF